MPMSFAVEVRVTRTVLDRQVFKLESVVHVIIRIHSAEDCVSHG
jgi:hypothetical protein